MGHPDKVADHIADAVLDHMLERDPLARVACEVLITGTHVVLAGEISSAYEPAPTTIDRLVRTTIREIGYTGSSVGFDVDGAEIHNFIQPQSDDIAIGVDTGGAGDQGMMFGHATRDADSLMPLPITLAHALVARQAEARISGDIEGLRPDAKAQVTVEYRGREAVGVTSVLVSTQHDPRWNDDQGGLKKAVTEAVIRPVLGDRWADSIVILVNPTGRFEIGGPGADTGLTGRKIIVDTYGGWGRHGGGAFSGKDPTKVDRSASYMSRYIAKNLVAAGIADEVELRLSYAIGVAEPTSVDIDTHGTGDLPDDEIAAMVRKHVPLTPNGIMDALALRRPIYVPTSYHGHFGRTPGINGTFTWERTDLADTFRSLSGV
jgi:S-adenosylmethionine synthetase